MTPEQLFAEKILAEVRKILADLPQNLKLISISSDHLRDAIDIDLGGGRSLALCIWENKRS